jgi:hypothetical protein
MEITSIDLAAMAAFIPLIFISAIAFWKESHLLYMLAAGTAIMTGLYTPDILGGQYTSSNLGISVGLILITLSFLYIAFAIKLMFHVSGDEIE